MIRIPILFLAGLLAAVAALAQPPAPLSPAARAAWGFDRSDLPPHPGVRFGLLPNGMRYAIMRNADPADALSVRLRIGSGASTEGAADQGFMHLIEHMIFHGSENLPQGSLPLMLQQAGLTRWTDFHAFTSFDETVYSLDLGRSDARARETSLFLMREIASRLRFTNSNVGDARKKIAEEIAGRDALQDRLASAQNGFLLPGTPLDRGPVAGTTRSLAKARPQALRDLYARTYRPANAVLVLVGDVDPDAAEAEIARHFGDWAAGAPTEPLEAANVTERSGIEASLFVDPAASTAITVASVTPLSADRDSGRTRDAHLLERLGSGMLARRLAEAAPDAGASAAVYTHFSAARVASLDVNARGRDWRGALDRAGATLGKALRDGFTQAELDLELEATRQAFRRASPPATSRALADAILDAAGRGLVYTEPGDPEANVAYLSRVKLADVNAAFRAAWGRPGRLIFVSHDRRIKGGEAAVAEAWRRAAQPRSAPARHISPGKSR